MRTRQSARPGSPSGVRAFVIAPLGAFAAATFAAGVPAPLAAQTGAVCAKTVKAEVVALDQAIFYNRLGAFNPHGMIFALRRDVVAGPPHPVEPPGPPDPEHPEPPPPEPDPVVLGPTTWGFTPGQVQLREGKRPRPLTLRVNEGECLEVTLQNLLAPTRPWADAPATRSVSIHITGLNLVGGIESDGSNVGRNASSLVAPGQTRTYTYVAAEEGTFLLYSTAATTGGEGNGGSIPFGLFGAVNVEPAGAEWYRSQITAEERALATTGTTPTGQPVLDYDARYPAGHRFAGLPILKMVDDRTGQIVHSDLTAIVTGANRGPFPYYPGRTPKLTTNPTAPFREFTVIFHDETKTVQAFAEFEDPMFEFTLAGVRDAFAINYGAAGMGAEVLANRKGLGPMRNCTECKYEEFFLSSWAVGDPSMVVDVPANASDPARGYRATKALYPDDPSNVMHSYMGDRVKFRNLHAGPKEHHIFHLHAHQWLATPHADNSSYNDSQTIGPGGYFSYDVTYGGSGNRNKTVGDAIFHCHFYPHFASGMWGLWRTHDVFEAGTELDASGRPAAGARALPDGEITTGTPIPALVPMPGVPLAPMPKAEGNRGYPFFIAGLPGHRAPRPPLDIAMGDDGKPLDGGLRRHVVQGGEAIFPELNTTDFSKENVKLDAIELPEGGTPVEQAAMAFHAQRTHPTSVLNPDGSVAAATFTTNGRPAVAGAPFADPCVSDAGGAAGTPRVYRVVSHQLDATYNKAGWHFPQHRMFSLWDDYRGVRDGQKPPQPLFFRTNTNDCIEFRLVNLVPGIYKMDDFQVRSPTDVMGQHIHLVKFDVTASDGSGNGFNYEDGALAPDEVRERIHAIRTFNGCTGAESGDARDGSFTCPVAKHHPEFADVPEALGAQENIQRWYTDDVLNAAGEDRTLRTVFTHDHFGPSAHQQVGLYAGLLAEPKDSRWRDSQTGQMLGTRRDGGPTSWAADILTADPKRSYREFALALQDFAHAYEKFEPGETFPNPLKAINPNGKFQPNPVLPFMLRPPVAGRCPNGTAAPCPQATSADDPGTMTVNYRNEPIALRVLDPAAASGGARKQATGAAGDLANAFRSDVTRADTRLNAQPSFWAQALSPSALPGDPFTPLLRAYEGDRVQIRTIVGAHEESHNFSVHGLKWLFEPSWSNSGFRNSQAMGISEHFESVLPPLARNPAGRYADYLWKAGSATDDLWHGLWGILRTYERNSRSDLQLLPNNSGTTALSAANAADFNGACPVAAVTRTYNVSAVLAKSALTGGTLVYNARTANGGRLHDPTAILYVQTADLDAYGKLRSGVPVEPLVLRARAGECIVVNLKNQLSATMPDADGYNTLPMIVDKFNANQVKPSAQVGLHPQLVATEITRSDGANVGRNPVQTAAPGGTVSYRWYAGDVTYDAASNKLVATPVEFGATSLSPADPIKHTNKGAVGALIIEPAGATWAADATSRASATVTLPDATNFREFVLLFQNDVNMRNDAGPLPNAHEADDPEDSGQKAFNYRTEPLWKRFGAGPGMTLESANNRDHANVLSNAQVGGADPVTPVFTVKAGTPVRFRVLHPGGHARNSVFNLHGHIWDDLPYANGSLSLGRNMLSENKGTRSGVGPSEHFDVLVRWGAGGKAAVTGDYLYRDMSSFQFDGGLWGILRVTP